ncbi:MAG: hypothetical protein HRT35_07280 [Algicola sp.]|nr:hypothetical protein [Algicola sp.]
MTIEIDGKKLVFEKAELTVDVDGFAYPRLEIGFDKAGGKDTTGSVIMKFVNGSSIMRLETIVFTHEQQTVIKNARQCGSISASIAMADYAELAKACKRLAQRATQKQLKKKPPPYWHQFNRQSKKRNLQQNR